MGDESAPDRTASPSPTPDELFEILSHEHRRFVLYTVRAFGPMSFDELVDVVTGWVYTREGAVATRADRQRVATAVHHVHLPTLLEIGFVTREADGDAISYAVDDGRFDELLEWCQSNERPLASPGGHNRGR